ncbi:hypothetical protein B1C78_02500 [Thioalkalivibrio denitrificans]|uniref:Uncharacterized protein n=1 Tax=Thioalkalivibrio denitrificans TaxID=108003 RepID=A0A1V3NSR6_9GAMM|nr:hypothetical protein [Thioalkalivibrio denitrificans]OOG27862.1 hypothetical protein B1C78_02500 [Thioalkalivibrio denitrificans]
MSIKQNPFSIYDFLGYFTPGAVFIYGVLLAVGHIDPDHTPFSYVERFLGFNRAEAYIPFILFAYVIGHFLSFVSSISVERYAIWAHGYPSKYLLGSEHPRYFHAEGKPVLRFSIRLVVAILLAPISILDWALGKKIGLTELYAKPLDPLLCEVLNKRIESLIDQHAVVTDRSDHGFPSDVDFFRYAYHYAVENAPNHMEKMQNYVALYGFLRTLTLISLLLFWAILWHSLLSSIPLAYIAIWLSTSAIVTYLFFMGFVKFYRRFSLEALMAMAVTFHPRRTRDAPAE